MRRKCTYGLFVVMALCIGTARSQVIWTEPAFPLVDEAVTVYFDAKECACPMATYNGPVYAHTGVIIEGVAPWQQVIGSWGDNNAQPRLKDLGNKIYSLEISSSILDFYKAVPGRDVQQMAFVFRSADATLQTADLFANVYEAGVANVNAPSEGSAHFIQDSLEIDAVILGADSVVLAMDGQVVDVVSGSHLKTKRKISTQGWHTLDISTTTAEGPVKKSVSVYVSGPSEVQALPKENLKHGVNVNDDSSVTLVLPAPGKNFVFVKGDFNDWELLQSYQMKVTDEGLFWIEISGLDPTKEYAYQYLTEGQIQVADPFAHKVLDPDHDAYIPSSVYPNLKAYPSGQAEGIVSTFQIEQQEYNWEIKDFNGPSEEKLVVYEILVREFLQDHSFKSLIDTLDYLENLGVNAIELMPIMEFEGNSSWGYNTSFHFALDKYYGTPYDFKSFVDACHQRGMAVILDLVINHAYGQNPLLKMYWDETLSRPSADSPWFNTISPNPVFSFGYDFNHTSPWTVQYFHDVLSFWMDEYHIDGYRLDFTKGLTNTPGEGSSYDAFRIGLLRNYAGTLRQKHPGAMVILEHFAESSEERQLAASNMMLWGNHNHNFNQLAMGYRADASVKGASHHARGFDEPRLMTYMESHDEERMAYKTQTWGNESLGYAIKDLDISMERAKMAATLWLGIPGPKLMWMFGELGYDVSIDDPCRICEKPIRWNYLNEPVRRGLMEHYARMIQLRKDQAIFHTSDFTIEYQGHLQWVRLTDGDQEAIVIVNGDVESHVMDVSVIGAGLWYRYFGEESFQLGFPRLTTTLAAGEYEIFSNFPMGPHLPSDQKLQISPNPGYDEVILVANQSIKKIEAFDSMGRLIWSESKSASNEITVSDWQAGSYFIRVTFEDGHTQTAKFVKSSL